MSTAIETVCTICNILFVEHCHIASYGCGHKFHKECIEKKVNKWWGASVYLCSTCGIRIIWIPFAG